MKKILTVTLFILLFSCLNEKEKAANSNKIPEPSNSIEQPEEPSEPEIYFVNAKEGLRVRDAPSLSGTKIVVLSHKEPVSIIKKNRKS